MTFRFSRFVRQLRQVLIPAPKVKPVSRPSGGRRRPTLEELETRLTPAFNLSLSFANPTSGVAITTVSPTTTFMANATGANLNWQDVFTELVNGNSVVITSGTDGTEAGNITDDGVQFFMLPGNQSLTIQSGTGTGLVGDITLTGVFLQGSNESLVINANHDVTVGILAAGAQATPAALASATITAATGSVSEGGAFQGPVQAATVSIQAATGIGSAAAPFPTQAGKLVARTDTGGIFLSNTGDMTLGFTGAPFAGVQVTGASGDIQLSNGGILTIPHSADAVAGPGNVTINAGALVLNGSITAGASSGVVTLNVASSGTATEAATGAITGNQLSLLGGGSTGFALGAGTNGVQSIAANTQAPIVYLNTQALAIATVGTTIGINSANSNVTLCTTNGDVIVLNSINAGTATALLDTAANLSETNSAIVTAATLGLRATGNISLIDPNAAGAVAFQAGAAVTYSSAGPFTIVTQGVTACFRGANNAAGGDITIAQVTGTLTVNTALNAGSNTIRLQSGGGVTQAAGGSLTAANLGVRASGAINLCVTGMPNAISGQFAADASAGAAGASPVAFLNLAGITIGAVTTATGFTPPVLGVLTNNSTLDLISQIGAIALTAPLNTKFTTTTATVRLQAGTTVSQTTSGIITAADLAVVALGNIDLSVNGSPNQITGNFAADASGGPAGSHVSFLNGPGFSVGAVAADACAAGATGVTSNNGNITLVSQAGLVTLNAPINAGTGTVQIISGGMPSHFTINVPAQATTGSALSITVTAVDLFGNPVTGYTGTVQLTSTDASAAIPVSNYTFTTGTGGDNGVHTFAVTLNTAGNQKVRVTDDGNFITTISTPIVTRGLVVTGLTKTPTGFTATFSKPLDPARINLYDITLMGTVANAGFVVPGSVLLSNNNQTLTYAATNLELPDDTYSLDLTSKANPNPPLGAAPGFVDLSGVPLDGGNNAGTADYITTFSTTYNASGLTVSLPDFARGPGEPVNIDLVNFHNATSTAGIPIQLSGVGTATNVSVPISYNANLLTITPVANQASPAGGTYSVATSGSGANATATFNYTPTSSVTGSSTPVTLGQLTASVPSAAPYKAKALLHIGTLTVVNVASVVPAVGQDGVEVVAFLGNASGLGAYFALDASLMSSFQNTGALFPNFPLADPNIIAGVDGAVDPNSISQVLQFNLNKPVPGIPAYTGAPSNNPSGPDPALAVGSGQWAVGSGQVSVPVNIDDPHPAGSTGLMQATLALSYDPKVFHVAPADVHLGAVPLSGKGWTFTAAVDPATGQIGISMYSLTPISSASAGSLVTIDLHGPTWASAGAAPVQLLAAVSVGGQQIQTSLADSQGFLTLHQAPAGAFVAGLDGQVLITTPTTASAVEGIGRAPKTAVEAANPILAAAVEEDNVAAEAVVAEANTADGFLARPSWGANMTVGRAAGLSAGIVPVLPVASPATPRLVEQVLGEQAHALVFPGGQHVSEALLWDAPDFDSDWLPAKNQGFLSLQGSSPHESLGSAVPALASDPAAADSAAWDAIFAPAGDELE